MVEPGPENLERARRVRLVLLDADGVLTDGRIFVGRGGGDARAFDVRDGHGIRLGQQAGLTFGILSGRSSAAVAERAAELGIDEVHQGLADKAARLGEILERLHVPPQAVCFMGDDLNDVPVLRRVGLAAAPADAVPEVRAVAHLVTERGGGRGAVRELVEILLHASGRWESLVASYLRNV